ncbi:MAG: aldo/keto reductase [Bacteroidetes bacterium]|nr:MAG: aldo/keto reductase [Bacteroidota bacterium]
MQYRKFAQTDISLSAIGLGCMVINHGYGLPDEKEGLATLEAAVELGINFWDTADMYANGQNEAVVSQVLSRHRSKIFLATKFGFHPGPDGKTMLLDCSPAYIQKAVDASLKRLKTDVIDLYYAHRVDPKVPVEETVGAMSRLVEAGKVRYLGLSEASVNSLRKAHAVHPISALQSEYSLLTREVEQEILPFCQSMDITFVPFSPLARGLVTNTLNMAETPERDFRRTLPRYQATYAENNRNLARDLADLARALDCTAAQLALAWVLAQGDHIIPIPGTKKVRYLQENAAAADIQLSPADLDAIQAVLDRWPNTGDRYNESSYRLVDKG